jgi:hypothetical protein
MARLAGLAEFWLGKPVIAINTATYWAALRGNGIADKVEGFGSLLAKFQRAPQWPARARWRRRLAFSLARILAVGDGRFWFRFMPAKPVRCEGDRGIGRLCPIPRPKWLPGTDSNHRPSG